MMWSVDCSRRHNKTCDELTAGSWDLFSIYRMTVRTHWACVWVWCVVCSRAWENGGQNKYTQLVIRWKGEMNKNYLSVCWWGSVLCWFIVWYRFLWGYWNYKNKKCRYLETIFRNRIILELSNKFYPFWGWLILKKSSTRKIIIRPNSF